MALFGPYLLGVEMASVLLLAGLVGTYHLSWHLGHRQDGERKKEIAP
jgi:NADH-quinone oxidoreductase subunit J